MFKFKWFDLQLFAGEGAGDGGGEGTATGESNAAAGHQRLLELGVPADKIRKNRSYKVNAPAQKPAENGQAQAQEQKPEQVDAAENPTEDKKTDVPPRMTWEEIMKDPEYNKQMQLTVQSRLRSAKGAEEALGQLTPALELLARKHGQDPAKMDYAALAKAISDDTAYYEDKALEMGVDIDTAKKVDQEERDTARRQRQEAITLEEQKIQNHIMSLERQGNEMKKIFPNFDLRTELRNPSFARLTSPSVGLSVEDAYYAVHRKELQTAAAEVTAQKTAQMISNAIQSGSLRPQENGTSGQAPSVTTFDYRNMSPEQRKALKDRIRSGEKIYPGQV